MFSTSSAPPRVRWAPDSRALLHAVTREGVSNIWRLPLDGSAPTQITNFKSDTISFFDLRVQNKGGRARLSWRAASR